MAFETLWKNKLVLWKFSGIVTDSDLLQSNLEVYGDSRFDDIRYQILDLLDVASVEVGDPNLAVRTIRRVAELDKAAAKTNPSIKVATVAHIEVLATLANLYESEIADSPWESEVFTSMDDAKKWLGISG